MSAVNSVPTRYNNIIESALAKIESLIKGSYPLSNRTLGLLLLQGDAEIEDEIKRREGDGYHALEQVIVHTLNEFSQPLRQVISVERQRQVKDIVSRTTTVSVRRGISFAERLSRVMMNPITGVPILLAILYIGLYQFVGVFGAGVAVDFLEGTVFGEWLNPFVTDVATKFIPWQILRDLFVGEYGVITLGLSYAIAIVLPIVGTFFFAFSIIEDSGYLPRLSMLIDRAFKGIGLSGRAVIPMVLGLGCDTMATIVTRIQETKRERVITTFLLALAIPCSAQLGVIFAVLSGNVLALLIWVCVVALVLLLVGYLASKVVPGERPTFYMQLPPLRLPKLSNVLVKTYTRLQWYFTEVMPFFILASVLLWLGNLTGVFDVIIRGLETMVKLIGLPPETAVVFLYGFFRRDFGAAGLYDLHSTGVISGIPLVVTAVTLTLFIPCIAQFMVMLKERGIKTAVVIALIIFPLAFLTGYILNLVLNALRVSL
jgi:ferrous iron transport protein B